MADLGWHPNFQAGSRLDILLLLFLRRSEEFEDCGHVYVNHFQQTRLTLGHIILTKHSVKKLIKATLEAVSISLY